MDVRLYDRGVTDLVAYVLAGGLSTRMGTDKAFLELKGRTLLDRTMALLSEISADVRIVGGREKFGGFGRVIEDEFAGHGPLGGIHAALRTSQADMNLILAVDMPFVEARFLEYLVNEARRCRAVVTLPRAGRGWQPLCAVYRKNFAEPAEKALREGRNKIDPLFSQVEVRVLDEDELAKQGFSSEMFRNLNTPEEFCAARAL
jgi:molybdopterin-guanine dinucleotide biosynthesis protein A